MNPARFGHWVFVAFMVLVYIFILLPLVVVIASAFSTTPFLTFPPRGFTLRWFLDFESLRPFLDALGYSVIIAAWSTLISVILGIWIALPLSRATFPGAAALRSFFLAPIIFPEIALALGLVQYFSQTGFIRGTTALVIAHSVVCTPYAIRSIAAVATRLDPSLEESAMSLGARPLRATADVVLPMLRPGIVAGGVMAFIMSFDNVTLSAFLAAPGAITLPALLYNQAAESGLNSTLAAVCALLIVITFACLILAERAIGLGRFFDQIGGARSARAGETKGRLA